METRRIALYARVSSRQQCREHTIDAQIAALREYARTHDYAVDDDLIFLDDGVSGSTLERPALDKLREQAMHGHIDQILMLCPDRLARKHAHQLLITEEFRRLGVGLIFINRPVANTPEDQLLLQLQGIIAEYEREKLKERSRRGKLYRARAGHVSVLGDAPYGYVYTPRKDGDEARYEIHPHEAQVVRRIFDLYTRERQSGRAIARQLNAEGIPTRSRKGPWRRVGICTLLKNPAYMGKAAFRKTRPVEDRAEMTRRRHGDYSRSLGTRPRPREEWIDIPVPAIIDERTYHLAQERLQENKKLATRNNTKHQYLLSGLLSC
jgi:site-specific DNA recombinase